MVGWKMTGSDTSNSPQHSKETPLAHKRCCLPLLLCGRVVALCSPHVVCYVSSAILHKWCCPPLMRCGRAVSLCFLGMARFHIWRTSLDTNIRTFWKLIWYSNDPYTLHRHVTWHLTGAAVAAAARGSGVYAGRASQTLFKTISYYNSSHTRRVLLLGGWTAAGQQDRSGVLWAKIIGKCIYFELIFKDVSREFDEFQVNTHLCKLRCWYS